MQRATMITTAVFLVVFILLGYVVYHWYSTKQFEATIGGVSSGEESEFRGEYTNLAGEPVDLTQFAGKVRVVNVWASWCPFCADELKNFAKLATEVAENDVVVMAINRKEPRPTLDAYVRQMQIPTDSPLLLLQDAGDVFYKRTGGFAMPETIFYRKDGSVAFHKRGQLTLDEMRQYVEMAQQSQ